MRQKEIYWFKEVCRQKSITKAAANLFITPQGLSKGMKNLENELNVILFERTPNGVELTRYGEMLSKHADQILKDYEELLQDIDLLRQQERGLLRVCSSYGIFRILGVDFILNFKEKYPEIELDYAEFPDVYVDTEIMQRHYDIGFSIAPVSDDPDLEVYPMFSSEISVLVYEGHPFCKRSSIRFADLKGEKLIIESGVFKIHHLIEKKCEENGFQANVIYNTSGFSLCHKLTQQKRGISIIVNRISEDMIKDGLVKIPIEDGFKWEAVMICKTEFGNQELVRKWKKYTRRFLEEMSL